MLKVVSRKSYEVSHGIDYKLENGVCLFSNDWNGYCYRSGAIETANCWKEDGHTYEPVYEENKIIAFVKC